MAGGAGAGAAGAETAAADPADARRADAAGAGAAVSAPDADTGNTLLHTAQRARTPPAGTLAGSTRYTVPHAGQVTFTAGRLRPARGRGGGRPRTPTPAASWRNSSFPLRARSPAPEMKSYAKTQPGSVLDRKSTRLNSSHVSISYAVVCLKKNKIP